MLIGRNPPSFGTFLVVMEPCILAIRGSIPTH